MPSPSVPTDEPFLPAITTASCTSGTRPRDNPSQERSNRREQPASRRSHSAQTAAPSSPAATTRPAGSGMQPLANHFGEPLKHQGSFRGLAFRPDGKMLVTGGWDKALRFWDPASGKAVGAATFTPEPDHGPGDCPRRPLRAGGLRRRNGPDLGPCRRQADQSGVRTRRPHRRRGIPSRRTAPC